MVKSCKSKAIPTLLDVLEVMGWVAPTNLGSLLLPNKYN